MAGKRALISTDELRKMAKLVAEYGVTFRGRVDPLGNFSFAVAPTNAQARNDDGDDLDDRLAEFGSQ